MGRWIFLLICVLIFSRFNVSAQGSPPWERPLMICSGTDGVHFSLPVLFQDSSGVPSMCRDSSGRLLCVFQWFPAPFQGPNWDSVAVKFSADNGVSWTPPVHIEVSGLPAGFQRPFDPSIVALPGGLFRLYFSNGPLTPPGSVATYSALGSDGIHFQFEAGARFSQTGHNVIDPTVTRFNSLYHYVAPKGAPQDGAYHAISTDGLLFNQVPDIPSDSVHNWTGNLLADSTEMRFYGSGGASIWFSTTPNGGQWSSYNSVFQPGGDPAVVLSGNRYILVFTGAPVANALDPEPGNRSFDLYPNPASNNIQLNLSGLKGPCEICFLTVYGKVVKQFFTEDTEVSTDISSFATGYYIIRVRDAKGNLFYRKCILGQF